MNQSKLSTFIIIYCFVAILSVWQTHHFSYNWQLQTLQTESSDQLLSTVSGIRQALDKFRYLPFLLTQNPNIHRLTIHSDEATSQNVSLFLEQTNLVAGSTALFILNKTGRTLAYSHWRDQQDFFERNHNDQPYFLNAENEAQTRVFSMLIDGKAAFFMSAPIYHTGALTGVAVVRIDLSLLEPKLPQDRLYDIRDSANRILFTRTNKKLIENNFNWQPSVLDNGTRIQIGHSEHGPKYTRQAVTLDDLKWSITVYNNTLPVRSFASWISGLIAGGFIALGLLMLFMRERLHKKRIRQHSIEALATSEAQKKAIIDKAQVGLLTLNSEGKIEYINKMAQHQFAISAHLIKHQNISSLLASDDHFEPVHTALSRLNSSNFVPVTACEAVGIRADGSEFPILFSIRRLQLTPESTYLATITDITARKRLEYALRDANESLEIKVKERTLALETAQAELIQAEKLAALGRMSTAVVHELNQPLTAMRTYNAIAKQLLDHPEQLQENLHTIDDLINRMDDITRQLKVFAYKKPQQLDNVDVTSVLQRVLKQFKPRFDTQKIILDLQQPDVSVYILADVQRLEQVLSNLIRNACDAIHNTEQSCISIYVTTENKRIIVSVKDNGPGLSTDDLNKVFDPFFTTKPMGVGLGLGLSIVKSIVKDLEGTISASNNTKGGACFKISFPQQSITDNPNS